MSLALFACSGRKSSATATPGAPSDAASDAADAADAGDGPSGSGHLHMTGDATIDHDFVVEQCAIAPPGDGILSGYHMNAKDGDSTIMNLAVVIKNYDKDRSYSPTDKSDEGQVAQAMSTGNMGPLSLVVAPPSSRIPFGVMLKPTSTLVVTTTANGSKGEAKFTDMEAPLSFDDINLNSKDKPHAKRVSGLVTWTCGHVEHLDPTMNKAVNGMMDKLMPSR
ncbi:MAG: hypothetical protein JJD97_02795 [Gemmatimonadaceae bacterium]|nr:hypothetical protein [Gemmatimonadaceae bacterium]